jgi:hypothetical protein
MEAVKFGSSSFRLPAFLHIFHPKILGNIPKRSNAQFGYPFYQMLYSLYENLIYHPIIIWLILLKTTRFLIYIDFIYCRFPLFKTSLKGI